MSGLKVAAGAMDLNGRQTVNYAENLASELSSLKNNVDNLMAIWKGISANEFNGSYEEQNENFRAFQELLNELGETISVAASDLNQTEENNAAAGRSLFG
jgi:WXG100 family type VII secretion target